MTSGGYADAPARLVPMTPADPAAASYGTGPSSYGGGSFTNTLGYPPAEIDYSQYRAVNFKKLDD